jgi:hypothetical protein
MYGNNFGKGLTYKQQLCASGCEHNTPIYSADLCTTAIEKETHAHTVHLDTSSFAGC